MLANPFPRGSSLAVAWLAACSNHECAISGAEWRSRDTLGLVLECDCDPPFLDTGSDAAAGDSTGEAASPEEDHDHLAYCQGGISEDGCGVQVLEVVELDDEPITLRADNGYGPYTYTLTDGQRKELRRACGLR